MLEPLPETEQALADYLAAQEPELNGMLREMAHVVEQVVPECVGLSLTVLDQHLTFTLVAPSLRVAALDAMQYVEDGPCERAVTTGQAVATPDHDPLDEDGWQLYALAAAELGVRSSLSLPVRSEGQVVGGVNLYASSTGAFDGHHEEVARLVGATATEAITNADLSFNTRLQAVETPARLRSLIDIDTAVGILAARFNETVDGARKRLAGAASRSGLSESVVARVLVNLHGAN